MTTAVVLSSAPVARASWEDGTFAGYLFPYGEIDVSGWTVGEVDRLRLGDADIDADIDADVGGDALGDSDIDADIDADIGATVRWPTPESPSWWAEKARGSSVRARLAEALTMHGAVAAAKPNETKRKAADYAKTLVYVREILDEAASHLPAEGVAPTPEQADLLVHFEKVQKAYYRSAVPFYGNVSPADESKGVLAPPRTDRSAAKATAKATAKAVKGLVEEAKVVLGGCPCTRGLGRKARAVFGGAFGIAPLIIGALVVGVIAAAWVWHDYAKLEKVRVDADLLKQGLSATPSPGPLGGGGRGGGGLILAAGALAVAAAAGAVILSKKKS